MQCLKPKYSIMTTSQGNKTLLPRTARVQSMQESAMHSEELKQKQRISEQLKQKYIQDLQERNRKLKNEIQKITQILDENEEKQQEKLKDKDKIKGKNYKSNIGRSSMDNNPDLLKKQIENVYKQIKNYERQIEKAENYRVGSKSASDQIGRLQAIKYEKLKHLDKLNTELAGLSKGQVINSKKLKNNMGRQYYENQILKVGDELKMMRLKLRNLEERQKKKVANAKKQLEFIKKLQGQLLQQGVPMDQIEELKRKNIYNQIKAAMNRQKDTQKPEAPQENINGEVDASQEQVHLQLNLQPVTYQKLQQMKNQIKLYKKLHQDYEKRLISIQKQKQTSDKLIAQKKKSLEEKNAQIDKLNQEIDQVKHLVRRNNTISNGTIAGQPDSIRKLQRKKSLEGSQEQSKSKDKDEKKTINGNRKASFSQRSGSKK